jgi:hypothetical protein
LKIAGSKRSEHESHIGPLATIWVAEPPTSSYESCPSKDRYRGVLLGVAVGNLLGIPYESTPARYLRDLATQGPLTIDPGEKYAPWDDDVAQTVLLA